MVNACPWNGQGGGNPARCTPSQVGRDLASPKRIAARQENVAGKVRMESSENKLDESDGWVKSGKVIARSACPMCAVVDL